MSLEISGKPAVVERSRHATEKLANDAKDALPASEQSRTLIRSVRPK
jgi:hypothetical protein